ncbi:hypothetical protein [Nonomuraea dietziae]|uniref:hypothetical protein n=1 Tax=Nonomuraea dietziae TaxID=65515 RepID=UPI0033DE22A3
MIGPADVLLRRRSLVALDLMAGDSQATPRKQRLGAQAGVVALEAELVARAEVREHAGGHERADFAALVSGDVDLPSSAQVYALYPGRPGDVRRRGAADLISGLGASG